TILIVILLFLGFFVSPFFSGYMGDIRDIGDRETAPLGITQVFVKVMKKRKMLLLLWGVLAFADALLATALLYFTIPIYLALLGLGVILFIYVMELHVINVIFGKEVVRNGS
ncbi:MAG: hypothetical protein ACPL1Y_07790, partial [Thermoplasmata archaeon]